ncbi:hypothetical protein ACJX0J_009464, partial [Zea mays]
MVKKNLSIRFICDLSHYCITDDCRTYGYIITLHMRTCQVLHLFVFLHHTQVFGFEIPDITVHIGPDAI